ncbi:unnamed protein product [Pleuronectes platessa]|uniref:Uncharacterized protein n=1 Tax=Pleuronectes platessa TaxID=8262 RepID=A0A9N7YHY1_PLEPL|nr:unnamed protein product [Pleuronectes platessa]
MECEGCYFVPSLLPWCELVLRGPDEAQCAAPGGPHPVAPNGFTGAGAFFLLDRGAVSIAGAEGGPLEGTGYGGRRRPLWTRVGPFSRITSATATAGGTLRLAPSS